MSYFKANMH